MTKSFILIALFSIIACSLKVDVVGLFENDNIVSKERAETGCSLCSIKWVQGKDKDVDVKSFTKKIIENKIFALLDDKNLNFLYEVAEKKNDSFLECVYHYLLSNSKIDETPFFNVRFFEIVKESEYVLNLKAPGVCYRKNKITGWIKNVLREIYTPEIGKKITNNEIITSGKSVSKLDYFKTTLECHEALKKFISSEFETLKDESNYCDIMMKYYENLTGNKEKTIENYVEAEKIIIDFCNVLNLIEGNLKRYAFDHIQAPLVKNSIGKISKALAMSGEFEPENVKVKGYNADGVSVDLTNKDIIIIDESAVVTFKTLNNMKIESIEVFLKDVSQGRINITEYLSEDNLEPETKN